MLVAVMQRRSMHSPPRRPCRPSSKKHLQLPVVLYIPNLICYLRIYLAVYALYYAMISLQPRQISSAPPDLPAFLGTLAGLAPLLGQKAVWGWLSSVPRAWGDWGLPWSNASDEGSDSNLCRWWVLFLYLLATALDVVDGYAARTLNQCSHLGAVLDVLADNVLRCSMWLASALACAERPLVAAAALAFTSIEWMTLLATQLTSQAEGGRHWKTLRAQDPWIVVYFFSNNFRNPLGALGIAGLFSRPLLPYLSSAFSDLLSGVPGLSVLVGALACGRLVCLGIEMYFIAQWVQMMTTGHEEASHQA